MNEDRPIYFAWSEHPLEKGYDPDSIYERLSEEILNPDINRSQVITLHLYIEYWLDRCLEKLQIKKDKLTFHKKLVKLNEKKVFKPSLYNNLLIVNQLRNIYAHELDLSKTKEKVKTKINELETDLFFTTSDSNRFRSVCMYTMFLLEATYNNGCIPPERSPFPVDATREKLIKQGTLHWNECELISRSGGGYVVESTLRCPLCNIGSIKRERDSTPGFKESSWQSCEVCGLSGDRAYVDLSTADPTFINKARRHLID